MTHLLSVHCYSALNASLSLLRISDAFVRVRPAFPPQRHLDATRPSFGIGRRNGGAAGALDFHVSRKIQASVRRGARHYEPHGTDMQEFR